MKTAIDAHIARAKAGLARSDGPKWLSTVREVDTAAIVAAYSEAQAKIEALVWLVEVQDLMFHGVGPAGWEQMFVVGICRKSDVSKNAWGELRDTYDAARAADGV